VVNKGTKILDGEVKTIIQQFKENLFNIGFEHLPALADHHSFEVAGTKKDSLIVKINEGYKPNDVLQYFLSQNAPITSFREILPTLNEIFIKLVEGTPMARQFQPVTA